MPLPCNPVDEHRASSTVDRFASVVMPRKVGKSEEYAEFDERARDSRECIWADGAASLNSDRVFDRQAHGATRDRVA